MTKNRHHIHPITFSSGSSRYQDSRQPSMRWGRVASSELLCLQEEFQFPRLIGAQKLSARWITVVDERKIAFSRFFLRTTIFAENTSTCVEFLAREHVSLAFDVKNVLSRIQNDECRQDSRRSEENCEFLFSASQRMSALSRVPLRTAWWLAAAASRKRSSFLRESNSSLLNTVNDVLRWKNAKGKLRFGTQNLILKEENPFISSFPSSLSLFSKTAYEREQEKEKEGRQWHNWRYSQPLRVRWKFPVTFLFNEAPNFHYSFENFSHF